MHHHYPDLGMQGSWTRAPRTSSITLWSGRTWRPRPTNAVLSRRDRGSPLSRCRPGDAALPSRQHVRVHRRSMAALSSDVLGTREDQLGLTTMAQRMRVLRPRQHRRPSSPPDRGARTTGGRSPRMARPCRRTVTNCCPPIAPVRSTTTRRSLTSRLSGLPGDVPARRLEDGQPRSPRRRPHGPARLGLSRRGPGLLGPRVVPRAEPGPAARSRRSSRSPATGPGSSTHGVDTAGWWERQLGLS